MKSEAMRTCGREEARLLSLGVTLAHPFALALSPRAKLTFSASEISCSAAIMARVLASRCSASSHEMQNEHNTGKGESEVLKGRSATVKPACAGRQKRGERQGMKAK